MWVFFTPVVFPLFFRVFRALPPPLGAVNLRGQRWVDGHPVLGESDRVARGRVAQMRAGGVQERHEPRHPFVGLGLAEPKL